jgi:hypothetical protein
MWLEIILSVATVFGVLLFAAFVFFMLLIQFVKTAN